MCLDFGTKAETLEKIHGKLNTAKTLRVFRFSNKKFSENGNGIIDEIQRLFTSTCKIVVRSSALNEDAILQSNAGAFESVLNIDVNDKNAIRSAINSVFDSYDTKNVNNEVFIQPMLQNVAIAGVAFSADLSTLAPYYVINYDESGKTNTVTSGVSNDTKTYISYKNVVPKCPDDRINKVILAVKELENIFNNSFIDVEFAVTSIGDVYILQVRPISVVSREIPNLDLDLALLKINHKIAKLQSENPNLLGTRAIFGVMPDWNPAEIIGTRPKKLALSLYKELITDNIWAYQRDNYGYLNLRSHPLLISFLGVPFIDVRADFNSFIPKCMDKNVAKKLVKFYLEKLYTTPSYHDKVEFKIIYSCYHLDMDNSLNELALNDFSNAEIDAVKQALLTLTNEIVSHNQDYYKADLQKADILREKHEQIANSDLYIIDKIYWLIEYCKRYGTLPFAGVARSAFIAVQFLQSFISTSIISQSEYNQYMNTLDTVSKKLINDLHKLNKDEFLKVWGHLRPGTYDIMSLRYDEGFEYYFSSARMQERLSENNKVEFQFSDKQKKSIQNALNINRISISVEELLVFIKESIEGREYSKFIFTKTLSQILKYVEEFATMYGISKQDAAYVDISVIRKLYSSLDFMDVKDTLLDNIRYNKSLFQYTKAVKLPSIILSPDDVYGFFLENGEANFITMKKTKAETVLEEHIDKQTLSGKIVFIKSADPGYDFLFTKNIAGLITQYGGANSHMAIRCAELGVPAVIGAGEKNFNCWAKALSLEIDCANKKVVPIS